MRNIGAAGPVASSKYGSLLQVGESILDRPSKRKCQPIARRSSTRKKQVQRVMVLREAKREFEPRRAAPVTQDRGARFRRLGGGHSGHSAEAPRQFRDERGNTRGPNRR